MANKAGTLLKKAREEAKLTQTELAKKADCGLTPQDISEAERGLRQLTQTQLKKLASCLPVTQAALLEAAKADSDSGKKTASKKSETAKGSGKSTPAKTIAGTGKNTVTKKTPAAQTGSKAKASSAAAKKTASAKEEELKLSAAEKKLLTLWRAADKDAREKALALLRGDAEKQEGDGGLLGSLLSSSVAAGAGSVLADLANAAADKIFGGK